MNHQNKLTHPHPKRNFVPTAVATKSVLSVAEGNRENAVKVLNMLNVENTEMLLIISLKDRDHTCLKDFYYFDLQRQTQDQRIFNSGCSRHMTGNKSFLTDYQEIDGGFVAFGGSPKGGKITGKRTPQQNGVSERKNRTLIEAAKTMLADSFLPTTFWAEAVNTACYVQNRVLVTKPHNKTPYELLHGRPPSISFMRPFGCPVTILNTLDSLGKFDGKADDGGPDWLFDIDLLTNSMNYEPVIAGNQTNRNASIKDNVDAVPTQQYIWLPLLSDSPQSSEDAVADDAGKKITEIPANKAELDKLLVQQKEANATTLQVYYSILSICRELLAKFYITNDLSTDLFMPEIGGYTDHSKILPIPTTRIHKDHPKDQIIRDINSATQTRRMTKISEENALRYQVTPKVSHLHAVKRIFRYLKGQPKLGLWYPRDSPFDLEAFSDMTNSVGQDCALGRFGAAGRKLSTARQNHNETQIHATVDGKTIVISESSVRSNLHFKDEEVVITTVASHPQKTHTPRQAKRGRDTEIPQSSGPPKKDNMEHQDDLTDFVPPTPHYSPLSGGHTPGSDEEGNFNDDFDDIDDMVNEAMQNVEGDTVNAGGTVNTATTGVSATSALVTTASVSISTAEPRTPPTTTTTAFEDEDLTIAQTLVKMRSQKDKEKEKELLSELHKKNLLDQQEFFQLLDQPEFFQLLIQKIKAKALCKNLKRLQRTQERLKIR
ncbi:ribonuclease H-like domain-containing protein [Tanacetum coccineum]